VLTTADQLDTELQVDLQRCYKHSAPEECVWEQTELWSRKQLSMADDSTLPSVPVKADDVQTSARASFLKRMLCAVQRMTSEMTDKMILPALAAISDSGAVARALGDSRLVNRARQIDPLVPGLTPYEYGGRCSPAITGFTRP
jgi:hypothetical protein